MLSGLHGGRSRVGIGQVFQAITAGWNCGLEFFRNPALGRQREFLLADLRSGLLPTSGFLSFHLLCLPGLFYRLAAVDCHLGTAIEQGDASLPNPHLLQPVGCL